MESVGRNRSLFFSDLGIDESELAIPGQISRDQVQIADKPGKYSATDALITTRKDIYLSVLTADCAPVLFWSSETPLAGAVHSGWQGSELDILGKALRLARDTTGCSRESLYMVIGPGLTAENFEVGPEFEAKFPVAYLKPKPGTERYCFDNNAYLRDTAIRWGMTPEHIEILPYCSYRDDTLFFSHRRDRSITGRMMSVIGIRS